MAANCSAKWVSRSGWGAGRQDEREPGPSLAGFIGGCADQVPRYAYFHHAFANNPERESAQASWMIADREQMARRWRGGGADAMSETATQPAESPNS
jgi:hypothetical protein